MSGCHHPPRQPQSGVLEGRVREFGAQWGADRVY